jgi:hypothetical protein
MSHIPVTPILPINMLLSTLVFYLAYRIYLRPKLASFDARVILTPILLLHSLRHLGLMFIAPGVTLPGMPREFAIPAAYGDLLTAILALAALFALHRDLRATPLLLGLFTIVGFSDLVSAVTLATITGAPAYMSAAAWIPVFWVPLLLVTHGIVFVILRRGAIVVPSAAKRPVAAS